MFIGQLGKGAFATVYQLATKMEGKLLAAKELEKRRFMKNGQLDKKIDNEMKIMKDLRHPNIVEFVEYHDQGDYLYIIMEFVRHGDLQSHLNQHGSLKEPQARLVAQQLLSALSYLHRMKITHRDIKPDNILIAELDPISIKLSDFGLSKVVKHDETFLKTFCGTLLYCAPEVFPDYENKPVKGTKRRRGSTQQFHSYSSSVDTWSFAAVLWFAMCGKPPFEGIADATGRAMYNNIMSTCLDPTPLREAGISELCIDLLLKMLNTDPSRRPTDHECLSHPWLKDGAPLLGDPALQSILEEEEPEETGEQLSQLHLHEDEIPESDNEDDEDVLEDEEFDTLIGNRQSKKIRIDPLFPRNQLRDYENDSSADASFRSERFPEANNHVESFKVIPIPPARPRLFGEIGQSALQSSGILNAHANEALSNEASGGEVLPDNVLPDEVPSTSNAGQLQTPAMKVLPQLDGSFSSPSLLGAESMVRELNMASPQSPGSGVHSPNEPATPKTPEVPQHNSLENQSQHPSQFSDTTPKAKPPALNRQISLPKTASFYYDPYDPTTHTLEYASKISGFDFVSAAETVKAGEAQLPDTIRFSAENQPSSQGEESVTSGIIPALPSELAIKPPPRRLGKLIATPDSFVPNLALMLDQSRTSWGRLPGNTLVYESPQDTRIPKTAFVIFWYTVEADTATVKELSQQGKDWTSLAGLHVGIITGATSGISINGKHLRKKDDKGRALFGHLHSGDIIQVYHDTKGTECLKFKCEFYHGAGKEPRPPGESFNILLGNRMEEGS